MFRPPLVYSRFKVLEQKSLTVSMKVFMNNITIFQFNEIYQPNEVQGRAPTESCGAQPLPLRIFTFKGASVAFVWVLKIRTHQYLFLTKILLILIDLYKIFLMPFSDLSNFSSVKRYTKKLWNEVRKTRFMENALTQKISYVLLWKFNT